MEHLYVAIFGERLKNRLKTCLVRRMSYIIRARMQTAPSWVEGLIGGCSGLLSSVFVYLYLCIYICVFVMSKQLRCWLVCSGAGGWSAAEVLVGPTITSGGGGLWVPNTVILCNLCSPPGATFNIGPFVQSHAHLSQVTIHHRTPIDQRQTEHQWPLNFFAASQRSSIVRISGCFYYSKLILQPIY